MPSSARNKSDPFFISPRPPEDDLFKRIAESLESRGYACFPAALPKTVADSLLDYLGHLEQDSFRRAGTGRGQDLSLNHFVRRDKIHWLVESDPNAADWLDWTSRLQVFLNRRLFLGLFSFESHFSYYWAGDFYRRHLDAFQGESNRILSLVAYLNKGWEPDQGGELVIYSPEDGSQLVKVTPEFGTLVLFLSEEFEHEVLPTRRDRYAVAGWFRLNTSLNDSIDPPG